MNRNFLQSEIDQLEKKKKNILTVLKAQPQRYLKLIEHQDDIEAHRERFNKLTQITQEIKNKVKCSSEWLTKQREKQLLLVIEKEDLEVIIKAKVEMLMVGHFVFQPCDGANHFYPMKERINSTKLQLLDIEYRNIQRIDFKKAICNVYTSNIQRTNDQKFSENNGTDEDEELLSYSDSVLHAQIEEQFCFMQVFICQNGLEEQLRSGLMENYGTKEAMQEIQAYMKVLQQLKKLIFEAQSSQGKEQNRFHQDSTVLQKIQQIKEYNKRLHNVCSEVSVWGNKVETISKELNSLQDNQKQLETEYSKCKAQLSAKQRTLQSLQNRHETFEEMRNHDLQEIDKTLKYLKNKLVNYKSLSQEEEVSDLDNFFNKHLTVRSEISQFNSICDKPNTSEEQIATNDTILIDCKNKPKLKGAQSNLSIVLSTNEKIVGVQTDSRGQKVQAVVKDKNRNKKSAHSVNKVNKKKLMLSCLDAEFETYCHKKQRHTQQSPNVKNQTLKENNNLARLLSPTVSSNKKKTNKTTKNQFYSTSKFNSSNKQITLRLNKSPLSKNKQNLLRKGTK